MSISAIGAAGFTPIAPFDFTTTSGATTGTAGASGAGAAGAASALGGGGDVASSFATQLGNGLENLQALHTNADQLAVRAATGSLTDVHDYMIASTEASLATELTVAVRTKAIDAFNEIMRMQA